MTPQEYVDFNNCKPLTRDELSKGKDKVKMYNTNEYIPWTEVYTYIAAGKSMVDIVTKYGMGRQIALWAIHDNQHYIPQLGDIVTSEIENRKKFDVIERTNPVVAQTLLDIANEYAPDFARNVVLASSAIVGRIGEIVRQPLSTSNDMMNCANALQKVSDTVGTSERFSASIKVSGSVSVSGFHFEEDVAPIRDIDAIDGDIDG